MNETPTIVVANVLISEDNELLMGLRSDRLEWEVPGGKVQDETLVEAYNRELLEETGMCTDERPSLLGISEPDPAHFGGRRYVILFMQVRSWHGFPQRMEPEKCLSWRWFSLDDLPPPEKCTPGSRDFFANILPRIRQQENGHGGPEADPD